MMMDDDDDDDNGDDEPDKIPTHHLGFCPLGFCPLGFILHTIPGTRSSSLSTLEAPHRS